MGGGCVWEEGVCEKRDTSEGIFEWRREGGRREEGGRGEGGTAVHKSASECG